MNSVKFSEIFIFKKKSGIKAGGGLEKGNYPFYTSSPTISKYLDTFQFDTPSLVFGTGGNASIHISDMPFSTSTDCFVAQLTAHASKQFELKFIYYYLHENMWILEKGFKGAGLKHISKEYINNIEIPVIPYLKQKLIVDTLDEAFSILSKRKKSIQLLDEYIEALFIEMFGEPVKNPKNWNTKQFKDISEIKIGPFGSLLHRHDYIEGGTPLVNPTHITNKKIIPDPKLTISEIKLKELRSYLLREGDIVLGRRGEIGRCGLVTQKEDNYLCGTGSMFIRPHSEVLSSFIVHYISTLSFKRLLESKAIGITMKNLNASTVQNMPIYIPPINLQMEFEKKNRGIEILKLQMNEQSEEFNNQFKALIQHTYQNNQL